MGNIKHEIEAAAIDTIKCPSCGVDKGLRCRNTVANSEGRHVFAKTHQRRLSAFMASGNIKWGGPQQPKGE